MKIKKHGKRWMVDYYSFGTRARHLFESRREAEEFKRRYLLGSNAPAITKSIRECVEDYKATFSSLKESATNEKVYFKVFLDYMSDLNVIFPHQIELIHLQKLQRKLRENVSGSTVNRQFNTYKHFITQCELWGFITKTPLRGLVRMKEAPRKKKIWKHDEIDRFFGALTKQWERDVAFLFSRLGVRPSEIVRLTWKDIDFAAETITIRTFKGSGDVKERTLRAPKDVLEHLKEMRSRSRRVLSKNLIVNERHQPVTANATKVAMSRGIKRAGLNGLTFYALKHTLASWLRDKGTDLETIRQILGHSRLNTTQAYIMNLEENDLAQKALDDVFKDRPRLV